MKLHRVFPAVALATLMTPLASVAQPVTGSVTTSPLGAVPVMGVRVLALLVLMLAGLGAYFLRRAGRGTVAKVACVLVLTALAGLAYAAIPAGLTFTVEGPQCTMQTVQVFDPNELNTLVSHCPNPIAIVSIQVPPCMTVDPPGPCSVGQVLADNDSCTLPLCDFVMP